VSERTRVVLPGDPVEPHEGRLLQRDDDVRYFRRWAEDIRAEFKRAVRRRRIFQHWQPEEAA
jgi:hypothetical protein